VTYNTFFMYGWIHNQLGLGLCFLALGLWLRFLSLPRLVPWFLFAVAATCLYFTHLLGFAVAGFVATVYLLVTRPAPRLLLLSWAAFLPGAAFYLHSRSGPGRNWNLEFGTPQHKLFGLATPIRGYSNLLDLVTVVALLACAIAVVWRNREFRWNGRWWTVLAALLGLYAVFPRAYAGGDSADIRLLLFMFIVGLAVARVGARARVVVPLAFLLFVLRIGSVAVQFHSAQPRLADMAASFLITSPNSKVLPIVESRPVRSIENVDFMFWGYGVIERGWFSPYLFSLKGIQPLALRLDLYRPRGFWAPRYEAVPDWNRIRESYDYVWAYNVPRFHEDLSRIGELVFERGDLRVYRITRVPGAP
jgi:hypothetical protein